MSVDGQHRSTRVPGRFVGLHAHSGFSTYDGLDYPQDHIDYVMENGMDAWALTDHGHMNGYCHAYLHAEKLKKSHGFKFIPGCEMYVHPDLDLWRLDYEMSQASRRGDSYALAQLQKHREEIATPLFVQTDSDDEIVEVGTNDDTGLTVENEEESKSGKFNDPVKRRHHLVVLPKTSEGLQRLFGLVSRGYSEGFYRFPRIDYKMLKEASAGGHLMVSTACLGGALSFEVFSHLQKVEFDGLSASLLDDSRLLDRVVNSVSNGYDALAGAVGHDNVMLELQFNKLGAQHLVNRAIIEFASRNGLKDKLIVTCDSHYSRPDRWKEREIYKKLGWMNHQEFDPSKLPQTIADLKCELYPKNASQVWETYKETTLSHGFYDDDLICDAIERTHDIAHNVIGEVMPDRSMKLPSYVVPKGLTDDQALIEACKKGLIERGLAEDEAYVNRLKYELKVIKDKQFSRYFLTMAGIIDIARRKMLVGPGRGSAGGSLVAYVLRLTDVDPLDYDLMFERFLNPNREGAPDIDTDVGNRDELINLMRDRWGAENIIPISNYNTFKLKSLVKDVSRFYGIPFEEVNAALAPVENDVKREVFKPGTDKNLFVLTYEDAMAYSKSFRDFLEKYPHVAEPIQVLFKQNKALGRHAGGVIVAENIAQRMPLIKSGKEFQTPWVEGMNYKHLETFGWIKFDLLGLETLRTIERTIELILKRRKGIASPTFDQIKEWFEANMNPKRLDLNDQHVYKHVYEEGRFAGVFQLTQKGAQKLFMKAKPKSIVDIATLTSIYRPGPLTAHVDKIYLEAKADPESIRYGHPLIKQVLEETSGCIIFQEQIMRLCSTVAGFPEKETDNVRRSLMKRKASEIDKSIAEARATKERFVAGAVANGVDASLADDLYEKILFFSGYGFNKAHAVSYAIDSYWCAWLLTYYEEEWLCAYLESMSGNPEDRAKAFNEVRKLGYKIVPIDINHATTGWTILEGKRFMPSFLSCKGIGLSAIEEIMEHRPYKSAEDLLWGANGEWKHSKFNKRAMEALIKIRAFDSMGIIGKNKTFSSYKQMHFVVIDKMDEIKKRLKKDPDVGRKSFNRLLLESADTPEWTRTELAMSLVEHLGSCNASALVPDTIMQKFSDMGIRSIDDHEGHDMYWFIVTETKQKKTKNGKPYLALTVSGDNGTSENMYMWNWDGKMSIDKYAVCIAEVDRNDFGFATKQAKIKIIR